MSLRMTRPQKKDYKYLIDVAERRGVTCFLHYTPVKNLPSILRHGILSRKQMQLREIRPILYHGWGKKFRELDEYICLSIVPPKGMIDRTKEAQVALEICPSVIGYSQSYFSPINSAKENIDISEILSLDTANAFESLFQYDEGIKLRNEYAEILVKDYIPVSDIRMIYYANWDGNGKILFPYWIKGMFGFSPKVVKSHRLF